MAHFQRGVALANLEQLDAAITALSCAVDLEPGHVRALYARASCRNRKADFALANGAGVRVHGRAAKLTGKPTEGVSPFAEDYMEALRLDDSQRSLRLRRAGAVSVGSVSGATVVARQVSIQCRGCSGLTIQASVAAWNLNFNPLADSPRRTLWSRESWPRCLHLQRRRLQRRAAAAPVAQWLRQGHPATQQGRLAQAHHRPPA